MSCHTSSATTATPSDTKSDGAMTTTTSTGAVNSRREFNCCICCERFERWRSCALHLWKTHEVDAGLLSCPVCHTYKTVTAVKLENHIKIHGEARAYTCPDCGKGFKQASQLRNHRIMHLDRKAGPVPRWYASKRCDICFKSYADSKCLKKHIQAVHSKLRPYVCQVCGHASARKAMLQMHLRQHTGEKPYGCTLCDYRTAAHLIYRCLNAALSTDGSPLQANVTGSATSEDGTTQTITIQIPTQHQEGSAGTDGEDEETTPCFLAIQEEEEEGVDTGGITIPAEPDPDPGIVPGGS
ncbi:hypothetical protein C0J52_00347 [Blattella germanica]|nr:hypothetical protein C0J52_00347 [Blattella germanica]